MTEITSRDCTKCSEHKPLTEFNVLSKGKYGRASQCRECAKSQKREYYKENVDSELERSSTWRFENAEHVHERETRYRLNNPHVFRDKNHRRRARIFGNECGPVDEVALWQECQGVCQLCFEPIDRSLVWPHPGSPSLDHKLPLSKSGSHTQGNLQWTHLRCNLRKNNKTESRTATGNQNPHG